jgi:hypothetical protein
LLGNHKREAKHPRNSLRGCRFHGLKGCRQEAVTV